MIFIATNDVKKICGGVYYILIALCNHGYEIKKWNTLNFFEVKTTIQKLKYEKNTLPQNCTVLNVRFDSYTIIISSKAEF